MRLFGINGESPDGRRFHGAALAIRTMFVRDKPARCEQLLKFVGHGCFVVDHEPFFTECLKRRQEIFLIADSSIKSM